MSYSDSGFVNLFLQGVVFLQCPDAAHSAHHRLSQFSKGVVSSWQLRTPTPFAWLSVHAAASNHAPYREVTSACLSARYQYTLTHGYYYLHRKEFLTISLFCFVFSKDSYYFIILEFIQLKVTRKNV